ncbi:MAG: TIGR00159 family protein [Lachnospiraceae bacterium]|jgi:diadenylate cyclase|nr:TIGR00159 family protein [Lachnospiraceae bacterium]
MKEFFTELFSSGKIGSWMLPSFQITDLLDILVVAFLIYEVLKWLRKTRAWILFKGIIVVLVVWMLASILELNITVWIFEGTLSVGILAVIIIFQPEFRRALEQLGRGNFFTRIFGESSNTVTEETAENLIQAMTAMSEVKTGALIAVEQKVILGEYEQTGLPIDAMVTSQLIINIFEKNTPLHDGAMIIRQNRVLAATCYLPLSENGDISKDLGTRHRAALGLSEVSDAKVFIVSEETGAMSMAYGGQIYRRITPEFIRRELLGEETEHKSKVQIMRDRILKDKFRKKEAPKGGPRP